MTSCSAKIRPFPSATEVTCLEDDGHSGIHAGVLSDYAFPGSQTVIQWLDADRRTFRGQWTPCDQSDCVLPAGHRGNHAR